MESENAINISEIADIPEIKEEPIVNPAEIPKRELSQEEKETINKKFSEIFQDKLSEYFSKFTNDIDAMEKMKYEFSALFYELEKIKTDITDHFHLQNNSSNNSSETARDSHKIMLTSANAKSSKNNDIMRSKTPTKLKSNKIIDLKDTNNAAAKSETARNYNTEKSKTPMKTLKPKTQNSNLNNTISEITKSSGAANKDKIKTVKPNAESKLTEVSKSTVKTETGTKSTASSKANNPSLYATSRKIVAPSANATKRDMTPGIKKNKLVNLDTSTISNLDNSMFADNKGDQIIKNKSGKVSQFSSKNNNNKQDLNNTVIETNKISLNAVNNKKQNAVTSRKPPGKEAGAKPIANGKAGKSDGKKKEKDKNPIEIDENKDAKQDSLLKKENSVTNIMDIIAEKNKEANMEHILGIEKKEINTNDFNENAEHNAVDKNNKQLSNGEEGKVSKAEEEKNAEKKEVPTFEENQTESKASKPIENESDKYVSAPAPKNIPEYRNKKNKIFHLVILSQ
jgi:hypothetical protein